MANRDNTTDQPTPKSIREKLLRVSAHVKTTEMATELLCQQNAMWFHICEVLEDIEVYITEVTEDLEKIETLKYSQHDQSKIH